MTRRIFVTTIFLAAQLCMGTAHAQGYWGIQGGINFADMTGDFGDMLVDEVEDAFGE